MRHRIQGVLAGCLALLVCFAPDIKAQSITTQINELKNQEAPLDEHIIPGYVVVKLKETSAVGSGVSIMSVDGVDRVSQRFEVKAANKMFPMIDRLSLQKRATIKGLDRLQHIYQMEIDESLDPMRVARAYQALPEVEYAEPLYRRKITSYSDSPGWFEASPIMVDPIDPLYSDQTHLPHISLPQAWDVIKGEEGNVLIAVLDGGTDWEHADLRANIYTNPNEIPNNGIDDDNNDFIDDVNGWNFPDDSPNPRGLTSTPQSASHGTQTAGVVGAVTNNNSGIAGGSWNAQIVPVNVACEEDDGSICFTPGGFFYAIAIGADIVNASFGGPGRSALVQDLVETLYENGALVVTSAGNEGQNNDLVPSFPANYDNVMSVCWTGKNFDRINTSSNFGISVDVCAPGSSINVTNPRGLYSTNSGTSFSSPLAASVAALVMTQNPTWTVDQVREQVRVTSDDISSVNNTIRYRGRIGKGRVNALRALTESVPAVRVLSAEISDASGSSRIGPGEQADVTLELINYLAPVSNLSLTMESSSIHVTVNEPTINVGSIATDERATAVFTVTAANEVPLNEVVNLIIRMDDGASYQDVDATSTTLNSTNHNTGVIEVSILEDGNIGFDGFDESSFGRGFRYFGDNYLFEGGLVMGSGAGRVSDNIRGETTLEDDFLREEGTSFGIDDGRVTDEEGTVVLLDDPADTPNNIRVRQDSYADSREENNDFIIFRYLIDNIGLAPISNFHAGMFFDWDALEDPFNNYSDYDSERRMGIFHDEPADQATIYWGTRLLSDNVTEHFKALNHAVDEFNNSDKWSYISGGIQTPNQESVDVSTLMSGGPFTIDPGQTIEVAFAVVGATTLADLQAHSDAAKQLWDQEISGLGPNPVSVDDPTATSFDFALEEPYPNPVTGSATIQYEIPAAGPVELAVYDILGREVRSLVSENVRAGRHALTWDTRDETGRAIASGVYMVSLTSPSSDGGVKTATRKIVVVR